MKHDCDKEAPRLVMEDLSRMWLTDDEILTLRSPQGPFTFRMRLWQHKSMRPVVVISSLVGGDRVSWHLCQIARCIRYGVLSGIEPVMIEQAAPEVFFSVRFTSERHYYICPMRHKCSRASVEFAVGHTIQD